MTDPGSSASSPEGEPSSAADIEAVLRDTATLWEAIWQTTGEYVAVIDSQGIIRACNRVDDGFTRDQVVGHSLVRFTVPESSQALAETIRQVFRDGETRTLETTVRRLDGGLSYFALRLAPIKRAGRIAAALVCCENIRPLRDTEQALTHERNVLRRLLEIQERERQLVSYEIHDGLAQYLAGALMHFQAYAHEPGARTASQNLEDGLRLLQAAAVESRRLIGGLRPPALDELGLIEAIESLVAEAREDIPRVEFHHALSGQRLPPPLETMVFRIVQEALTNVRKHASAKTLAVTLERATGRVLARVADDGRGFDPAAVPEDRFGLEGIRQRARLFGGRCRIDSAPGQGATVEVSLPLTTEPNPAGTAGG
jgi:PAS domain S-box-containing protein